MTLKDDYRNRSNMLLIKKKKKKNAVTWDGSVLLFLDALKVRNLDAVSLQRCEYFQCLKGVKKNIDK